MECKVNVPEEAGGDPACIDLTRMECKVNSFALPTDVQIRIDLTRMECKGITSR